MTAIAPAIAYVLWVHPGTGARLIRRTPAHLTAQHLSALWTDYPGPAYRMTRIVALNYPAHLAIGCGPDILALSAPLPPSRVVPHWVRELLMRAAPLADARG